MVQPFNCNIGSLSQPVHDLTIITDGSAVSGDIDISYIGKTGRPVMGKSASSVIIKHAELEKRRKAWKAPEPKVKTGYLARYAKLVSSADKGAILL